MTLPLLSSAKIDHKSPFIGKVKELDEEVTSFLNLVRRHVENSEEIKNIYSFHSTKLFNYLPKYCNVSLIVNSP